MNLLVEHVTFLENNGHDETFFIIFVFFKLWKIGFENVLLTKFSARLKNLLVSFHLEKNIQFHIIFFTSNI